VKHFSTIGLLIALMAVAFSFASQPLDGVIPEPNQINDMTAAN